MTGGQARESQFEQEICEYLQAQGWLYSPTSAGYDAARAIFPEDMLGWLEDTQAEQIAKVVKTVPPPRRSSGSNCWTQSRRSSTRL